MRRLGALAAARHNGRVMRRLCALLLVCLAAPVLLAACTGAAASTSEATIRIHYSHFYPEEVTAVAGEPITITLQNTDPIEHEWIVGTEAVHEKHRTGTEPYHASIPTEVTIPALTTRVTTVMFHEPGDYKYICHLPGHEQYGMVGVLHVVAR